MPLYELFCLCKPALHSKQIGDIIKKTCTVVLNNKGVITDIRSFGEQELAYSIRKPGQKYDQAAMWQCTFAANPTTLPDIDYSLRIDDQVLRWIVLKRRLKSPLPNPYRIAKLAAAEQSSPQD